MHPTLPFLDVDRLLAAFVHDDAQVLQVAAGTWAIHGSIPYNGDTLLAEFDTLESASTALGRIPSGPEHTAARPR